VHVVAGTVTAGFECNGQAGLGNGEGEFYLVEVSLCLTEAQRPRPLAAVHRDFGESTLL
jgi:hypothetical protein